RSWTNPSFRVSTNNLGGFRHGSKSGRFNMRIAIRKSPLVLLGVIYGPLALFSTAPCSAGVTRTLGTEEITDTQESRTWVSPSTLTSNQVPHNDPLIATQAVTFGFTGEELALSRANAGYTHVQISTWREDDVFSDDIIASTTATYKFTQNNQ